MIFMDLLQMNPKLAGLLWHEDQKMTIDLGADLVRKHGHQEGGIVAGDASHGRKVRAPYDSIAGNSRPPWGED